MSSGEHGCRKTPESVTQGILFECNWGRFSAGKTGRENEVEKILFPGLEKTEKGFTGTRERGGRDEGERRAKGMRSPACFYKRSVHM